MAKDNHTLDLNINSVFEMLPQMPILHNSIAVLGEQNANMTWTEGKRLVMSDMTHGELITISVDELSYAIEEWEIMNDVKFDGMTITEQDAIKILNGAIQCKKRRKR